MAFDAAGVVVLFGGSSGTGGTMLRGDTWVWDGQNWSAKRPAAEPPPRFGHAMVYDSAREQVVLFGGISAGQALDDTWVWDGGNWTRKFPSNSPPARGWHGMAYDSNRGETVLFGGSTGSGPANDTWIWNGSDWVQRLPATSPPPRVMHGIAYDSARREVVLFGGNAAGDLGDTWVWDGTDWLPRSPAASPPARAGHAMAYDTLANRLILFGGAASSTRLRDTWIWDGANWSSREQDGQQPGAREGHALAFDAVRGNAVLFGGGATSMLADTWTYGPEADACTVTCDASVPQTATAGVPVQFSGTVTASNCFGAPTYTTWDFGDNSSASNQNPAAHTYAASGAFTWTLTGNVAAAASPASARPAVGAIPSCSKSDTITVMPVSKPSLTVSPPSLLFTSSLGAAGSSQGISIQSTGASLSYLISASTNSGGQWLLYDSGGGTTPGSLNISLDPGVVQNLASGTYYGNISISSPDAGNSPLLLPVTLTASTSDTIVLIVPDSLGTKLQGLNGVAWLSDGQMAIAETGYTSRNDATIISAFQTLQFSNPPGPTPLSPGALFNLVPAPTSNTWDTLSCTDTGVFNAATALAVKGLLPSSAPQTLKSVITGYYGSQNDCNTRLQIYNLLQSDLAQDYDVRTWAYDWRQDIRDLGMALFQAINSLTIPNRRVAIVAHGLGGLLTNEMLRLNAAQGNAISGRLGPIITLGTPYGGTIDAYTNTQGWKDLDVPGVTSSATRQIGNNWTAAYQELPRWQFVSGTDPNSLYNGTYNPALYPALPRWSSLSSSIAVLSGTVPAYSQAYAVVGTGLETPESLAYLNGTNLQYYDVGLGNGDGTVSQTNSAISSSWVPSGHLRYVNVSHSSLPQDNGVRAAIRKILLNPDNPSDSLSTTPIVQPVGMKFTVINRTVSTSGQNSCLTSLVQDATSRTTGQNARQIPGAGYLNFGNSETIWAPGTGLTVQLLGTATGTADLALQVIQPGQGPQQLLLYRNLSVTSQSKGTLLVPDTSTIPVLSFDQLGNGNPVKISPSIIPWGTTWTIVKTHTGNFTQGQNGVAYTISVANAGTLASSGQVTLTENLPAGLTLVSMSGQNWSCPSGGNACTRSDALSAGASYPDLTVTVNVAADAPSSLTNQASVSGGGASSVSAADPTTINPVKTDSPPQAVSVSPAVGTAAQQTFTFTFADPDGWQDLDVVNVLINNFLDGRYACYLAYSRPNNVLYLVNDAGTALLPGLVLNGSGSVANGTCTVNGAGSSAAGNGATLTLTLNMSFGASYAGNKVMYLAARDLEGGNSGWQALGTCNMPGGAATNPSRIPRGTRISAS